MKEPDLKPKLVVAEVEQVSDAGQQALVQLVTCGLWEDNQDGGRRTLYLLVVVDLVPIHGRLKHQQQQHQQMVLIAQSTPNTTQKNTSIYILFIELKSLTSRLTTLRQIQLVVFLNSYRSFNNSTS